VTSDTLLVVDDSDSGRYLKARALRSAGFEVHEAATATGALDYLNERSAHVVVLDVKLPDMHGFELCRIIKSRHPTICVLQTSATFTTSEDRVAGLDVGADAYLVEPMEETELVAIVRALLRVRQAEAARRSTEMLFAQFAQASPDLLWIYDIEDKRFEYVSPSVKNILGESPENVKRDRNVWLSKIYEADRPEVEKMISNSRASADAPIEYRIVREGAEIWVRDKAFVLESNFGGRARVAGLARDVTAAKRVEQQRDLMIAELNHRVKNTLALVQSLAAHTRHSAISPEAFQKAFAARLQALAQAHDLLTQSLWQGTTLMHVVETALAPFRSSEDTRTRVEISGPNVWLSSNTTVMLSLAFHELATNAAKYGALSVDTGRVDIRWAARPTPNPQEVVLKWRELGGPAVQFPEHRGFGSMLLEKVLSYESESKAQLSFESAGVAFDIQLPLSSDVKLM
jgi:PAS domain S-box-containing protein